MNYRSTSRTVVRLTKEASKIVNRIYTIRKGVDSKSEIASALIESYMKVKGENDSESNNASD